MFELLGRRGGGVFSYLLHLGKKKSDAYAIYRIISFLCADTRDFFFPYSPLRVAD